MAPRFKELIRVGGAARNLSTWNVTRLNHIAIAVHDLEKATAFYRDVLNAKVSQVKALPDHGVYTVFVELENTKLELLGAYNEQSPIANFLKKNPSGGIHHFCVEVDNIHGAIKDLKDKGIRTLSDEPKIGAHGNPIIFLHPKDACGVLTELELAEKKSKN